jgi:ABC-2 type transport system ATP-binding protein
MPQGLGVNLYESLSVEENIEFFRDLRKLPAETYRRNRTDLLNMTRLEPFVQRRVAHLSGGMRQKLALICTLIHLPDLILLDEPTTGVDPISRQDFWQIIRRLVEERRVTVLLSTSYMDEAERCHRIGLLHGGAILWQGRPGEIREKAEGRYARIIAEPQTAAVNVLRSRSDVTSTEVFGEEIHLRFEGDLEEIESDLRGHQINVRESSPLEATLEDVFLQFLAAGKPSRLELSLPPPREQLGAVTIECRGVTRRFGDFCAVDDVDLRIQHGEIFGLLGPNGAGKTTLIKMMCGLLEPSSGAIRVAGLDIRTEKERVWTQIGYMSQQFSLYRDLSVKQNLRLYSDLYGVRNANISYTVSALGLKPFESRLAGEMPAGLRQRLSLLCAVLHGPPVLFLDEPTSGVDPPARRTFWELIYTLSRESSVTVVVSTHYMDEATHCDRLGLMDQGRLIAADSPAALKQASERRSGKLLAVRVPQLRVAYDAIVSSFPAAVLYGDSIHFRSLDPALDGRKVLSVLHRAGITGAEISSPPLSMDETFIDFIHAAETANA